MEEFAARIRVQVTAPAREHGLIMPRDEQTSKDGFFPAFAAIKYCQQYERYLGVPDT